MSAIKPEPQFEEILRTCKDRVVERAGGPVALSRKLKAMLRVKITSQAIGNWRYVPHRRALSVSVVTSVPLHEIRPDIHPAPESST